jgi:hypothetical protein
LGHVTHLKIGKENTRNKKKKREKKRKQETILARNVSYRSTSISLTREENQQASEQYVQQMYG